MHHQSCLCVCAMCINICIDHTYITAVQVPDEAEFSDNEEYDAKEGFYDDELTKR